MVHGAWHGSYGACQLWCMACRQLWCMAGTPRPKEEDQGGWWNPLSALSALTCGCERGSSGGAGVVVVVWEGPGCGSGVMDEIVSLLQ